MRQVEEGLIPLRTGRSSSASDRVALGQRFDLHVTGDEELRGEQGVGCLHHAGAKLREQRDGETLCKYLQRDYIHGNRLENARMVLGPGAVASWLCVADGMK